MEYHILIVEPDTIARRRYAEALIAEPPAIGVAYRIITVGSIGAAQLQATRHRFDLLLTTISRDNEIQQFVEQIYDVYNGAIKLVLLHEPKAAATAQIVTQQLHATLLELPINEEELRSSVRFALGLESLNSANEQAAQRSELPLGNPATLASNELDLCLSDIRHETAATYALYINHFGLSIAQQGQLQDLDLSALISSIAGTFAHSNRLARLLHEQHSIHTHVHEGEQFDIYSTNVGNDRLLVLCFDKSYTNTKIGCIWPSMKRGAERLQHLHLLAEQTYLETHPKHDLTTPLTDKLQRLFGEPYH
jgi:predicted regulator of Ras-like GTPase activity (Roadblock/LC7/MglB family)